MNCQDEGKDCRECPIRNMRQSDHFLTLSPNSNVLSASGAMRGKKNVTVSEGSCLINFY